MAEQQLERFIFAHTLTEQCVTDVGGARRAILPVFKMGTTALVDNRSFTMDEQDFTSLKKNLAAKLTPCPVLYEHAKGPRGGLAGGKVISLQLKDGDIFAHATLTKRAYNECKDEEWLSCSGGFLATRDENGNIRPVELEEISFTNQPAFPGLSDIQTFSVLTPKEVPMPEEIKATETQVEVLPEPPPVEAIVNLEVAEAPPAPVVPSEGIVEAPEGIVEAPEAPITLEVAPEPVVLDSSNPSVGEVIAAMQEQIDGLKDLLDQFLNPAPAPAEMPMGMAAETNPEEEVVELTAEQNESIMEMIVTTRVDDKLKVEASNALITQGEAEGKIVPANRPAMEKFALADPEAFKVVLSSMKPVISAKKSVGDAVIRVDLGLLDTSPEREAEILTKAFQLQVKHPELTLTELSTIIKNHI